MFVITQSDSDFPPFLRGIEQIPLSPLTLNAVWTR